MKVFWRIRNRDAVRVCDCTSIAECQRLLDAYASDPVSFPGWSKGPYKIYRVTRRPKATEPGSTER